MKKKARLLYNKYISKLIVNENMRSNSKLQKAKKRNFFRYYFEENRGRKMKPILKYCGVKQKEIPHFKKYIPKQFDTYYEPFLGGGAVFFDLEPQKAVVNDVNKRLAKFYRSMQSEFETTHNQLEEIAQLYKRNQELNNGENEKTYYEMRDVFNGKTQNKKLTYATVYYYINKTAFSGMIRYNKKGQFNTPFGRYKTFPIKQITEEHHKLLERTAILNDDYSKAFDKATAKDFMFLDPPYDTTFSSYGNECFTGDFNENEQRRLAEDFKNLSCKAMMVIGETELTKELYGKYVKEKYPKNYAVNIKSRFKSTTNHLIITNY